MGLLSWGPNALTFSFTCGDASSSKWVGILYWVGLGNCGLVGLILGLVGRVNGVFWIVGWERGSRWVSTWLGNCGGLVGLILWLGERMNGACWIGECERGSMSFPHATFDVSKGHWPRGVVWLGN